VHEALNAARTRKCDDSRSRWVPIWRLEIKPPV
jgi:hypothetical protein